MFSPALSLDAFSDHPSYDDVRHLSLAYATATILNRSTRGGSGEVANEGWNHLAILPSQTGQSTGGGRTHHAAVIRERLHRRTVNKKETDTMS
jgi:hypothetical protein